MKYLIISLMLSLPVMSVHAQSLGLDYTSQIEEIQRHTKSIENSLHPEIVSNLPAQEQEAILSLLKDQAEELKTLNTLLREAFNSLSPDQQRDILLRLAR